MGTSRLTCPRHRTKKGWSRDAKAFILTLGWLLVTAILHSLVSPPASTPQPHGLFLARAGFPEAAGFPTLPEPPYCTTSASNTSPPVPPPPSCGSKIHGAPPLGSEITGSAEQCPPTQRSDLQFGRSSFSSF